MFPRRSCLFPSSFHGVTTGSLRLMCILKRKLGQCMSQEYKQKLLTSFSPKTISLTYRWVAISTRDDAFSMGLGFSSWTSSQPYKWRSMNLYLLKLLLINLVSCVVLKLQFGIYGLSNILVGIDLLLVFALQNL